MVIFLIKYHAQKIAQFWADKSRQAYGSLATYPDYSVTEFRLSKALLQYEKSYGRHKLVNVHLS